MQWQILLQSRFGLQDFRPGQLAICDAVVEGHDTLVVMPTGAGKSLCYQAPGIARGGTTLVISPLVALIEDQVQKLMSLGFRAERIHSGRAREDSREAFRRYLQGDLEFLFIAPERLAVPGFAEMLERKPPSLIAVDEAHCISQWGHDFRPDYRLVGERLGKLTQVPIIALTATATPLVQDDIVKQLALDHEKRFIRGFRRTNLAIEVLEIAPKLRGEFILSALEVPDRRPAILYAPTRKRAEELAQELKGKFPSASYHAGLPAATREQVQSAFLQGKIEVIVATVAFGMGIDKSNVRTVIHAAIPPAIESYYQEIGRAGRDGLPSRAILLHSFGDQKTHEFFLERDYPDVEILKKIRHSLGKETLPREALQDRNRTLEPEVFEKALEKLWVHGAIAVSPSDEIKSLPAPQWEKLYSDQLTQRSRSLRLMMEYTSATPCRMVNLVRHFGERGADEKCGICDRCRPETALSHQPSRALAKGERTLAVAILAVLAGRDGAAAGRLFEEAGQISDEKDRTTFESVLKALEASRLVETKNEEFEKEGKTIGFRRIFLTARGRSAKASEVDSIEIQDRRPTKSKTPGRSKKKAPISDTESPISQALFDSLRAWRLEKAREKGVPAFRILSDRVLRSICAYRPSGSGTEQLLSVPGLGPRLVELYGEELLGRLR